MVLARSAWSNGPAMALYSIHVACAVCPQVHPLGVRISVRHGPAERGTVAEAYAGEVPPQILESTMTCPNTGKLYQQDDLSYAVTG